MSLILTLLAANTVAFASPIELDDADSFVDKMTSCEKVELTEEQKEKLMGAYKTMRDGVKDLKAAAKTAAGQYAAVLGSESGDKGAAESAAAKVEAAASGIFKVSFAFMTGAFFDVLKPEQREPALKCIAHYKKEAYKKKLKKLCEKP